MVVAVPLLASACQQEAQGSAPRATPKAAEPRPRVTDVTAEDYVMQPLPRGHVRLEDAFGGARRVEVEIAATAGTRTRGMMWRKELAEGKGMLFLFPHEEVQGFWMRNTLIPLDMIFITSDLRVAGIVSRAVPRSLESRSVGVPSQYVLEVPGGWTEKVGIRKGSAVRFEGVAGMAIEP
ncbi:DUF192 domain-containing protein [Myxococcus xanthus]|uniref:DUF192 domain-containing protein n=1 Tax=Myxococcus xanthus TaxID=34 RepID=A0A7Y4IJB3_MYXXA|nr:DUF192 domain-containing protein [Myxococcus xanthus]NOJ80341.1 DUF192 domain-containing protein [Myxococcus xanthus]NOJ86769.1 DUF192 domain-containing protein [Myxococcus xanthus]